MPKRPKFKDSSRTTQWRYRKHAFVGNARSDSDSDEDHDDQAEMAAMDIALSSDECPKTPDDSEPEFVGHDTIRNPVGAETFEQQNQHDTDTERDENEDERLENFYGNDLPSPPVLQEHEVDQQSDASSENSYAHGDQDEEEEGFSDTQSELEDERLEEDNRNGFGVNDLPLYVGAPLSLAESMLAILSFCIVHKLSGSCLADLLLLIALHCPQPNALKKSLYLFHKYFSEIRTPLRCHYFCDVCYNPLESKTDICDQCEENVGVSYFIEIPIINQLKKMFLRPEFYDKLGYRFNRSKKYRDHYEDIYDGSIYKEAAQGLLGNRNNISFTWYTDGVSVYNSSKFSLWPFFFTINELSPKERIAKENLVLGGIWFGTSKPVPHVFLRPFVSSIRDLHEGILVNIPGQDLPVTVRGTILTGTCDLPAKSLFFNTLQYNGSYGCPKCLIRGEKSVRTENVHVYPYQENLVARTDQQHAQFVQNALESGEPSFGVKGPTWLSLLVPNMIRSTSIDPMHCVYLGTVKKLLKLWFDSAYHATEFSLSRFVNVIGNRIEAIKPPHFIQRLPRSIADHVHFWKASEYRSWFFFYSLPVLYETMNEVYFNHYSSFVMGIYLLNKDSVSESDIELSSKLLHQFVKNFETLYGLKHMTCNIHLTLHLPDIVRELGPLWVGSCFPYEDINGKLVNLVHGTTHAGLQISSSFSLFVAYSDMIRQLPDGSKAKDYCNRIKSKFSRLRINERIIDETFSLGQYIELQNLPVTIHNALLEIYGETRSLSVQQFHRVKKNGLLFISESYRENLEFKRSSNWVKYNKNGTVQYGCLKTFVRVRQDCNCEGPCICRVTFYAIVKKVDCQNVFHINYPACMVPFIFKCTSNAIVDAIELSQISGVCCYVSVEQNEFLINPVNQQELE